MKWFICSTAANWERAQHAVNYLDADSASLHFTSASAMRHALLCSTPDEASALIFAPIEDIEAINLAAACSADGHAAQTVLVADSISGSLRSRAVHAHIDMVFSWDEIADDTLCQASQEQHESQERHADHEQHASCEEQAEHEQHEQHEQHAAQLAALPHVDEADDLDEPAGVTEASKHKSPVICIASGRGGVGKTVLASLFACYAKQWQMKCALVDLDLCSGNMFSYFGAVHGADLASCASENQLTVEKVHSLGIQLEDGIKLFGPCTRPELAETLGWRISRILEVLSHEFDVVVVDTSTTVTDAVAQAMQMCDRLLLLARQDDGCIGSLARTASLAVRLGVARTRIVRVMNQCRRRTSINDEQYRQLKGLETARCFHLSESDIDLYQCLGHGEVFRLSQSHDMFARSAAGCLASVLSELGCLPEEELALQALRSEQKSRHRGFFARLREVS